MPTDGIARYRALEWIGYIGTELHRAFTPLFHGGSEHEKTEAREEILLRLRFVEDKLSGDWLMGEHFGVADAYLFVILRALEAVRLAKDRLGSYLVLGVLASFSFQVIYNITMSAGLAPVKGLTLPLMSYGGSSMIATLAGFGLVLNVRMRRFTN